MPIIKFLQRLVLLYFSKILVCWYTDLSPQLNSSGKIVKRKMVEGCRDWVLSITKSRSSALLGKMSADCGERKLLNSNTLFFSPMNFSVYLHFPQYFYYKFILTVEYDKVLTVSRHSTWIFRTLLVPRY